MSRSLHFPWPSRRWGLLGLTCAMLVGVGLVVSFVPLKTTHAATMYVVDICDAAHLDAVLAEAQQTSGNSITFSCSGDIALDRTLTITTALTIDGTGQSVTLDGHGALRDILVQHGADLTFKALTITRGVTPSYASGGGLLNEGGTVTLTNTTVSSNTANSGSGGGLDNHAGGTLTLTNSTVSDNVADAVGGGLFNNGGTLTLTNSTVSGNTAASLGGGGGGGGGGIFNALGSTLTVTNSTMAGNSAVDGGGLNNFGGTATLTNTTVSGNTVTADGGGIRNFGTLTLTNSTVAHNSAVTVGGGVRTSGTGASTASSGSIVAENTANSTASNCAGTLIDLGYNLESGTDCGFTGTGSLQKTDPKLAAELAGNGGPTLTLALLPGSPANDAIPTASGLCPATDQRGVTRPDHGETACDMGAYEFEDTDADLALTNIPADFTVDATSPQGAVVTYTLPTVVDEDVPLPTVTCAPAPGSTFPIGTTTITCTVSDPDDANSPVSASFIVTVKGAVDQINDLIDQVQSLDVSKGLAASLEAKVQNVQNALTGANADVRQNACGGLGAFINAVQAQSGKGLTADEANKLITDAQRIEAVICC